MSKGGTGELREDGEARGVVRKMNWIAPQAYTGGNILDNRQGKLSGTSPQYVGVKRQTIWERIKAISAEGPCLGASASPHFH